MAGSRLPTDRWLGVLGLQQYIPLFTHCRTVEDLLLLTDSRIRELGVEDKTHRRRMITSLHMMRDTRLKKQREQLSQMRNNTTPRTTDGWGEESAVYQPLNQLTDGPPQCPLAPNTDPPIIHYNWYHGLVPRHKAERLVVQDSDFLVRDCLSQPGSYVLTCHWRGSPLHFVINRVTGQDDLGRHFTQYQFENEFFASIPSLIDHYKKTLTPVSIASGVVISNPVTRNKLVEYYDTQSCTVVRNQSLSGSPWSSPAGSPRASPQMNRRRMPARAGSFDVLSEAVSGSVRRHGSSPVPDYSASPPRSLTLNTQVSEMSEKTRCKRTSSDPLSPRVSEARFDYPPSTDSPNQHVKPSHDHHAPPKPSRVPTVRKKQGNKPLVVVRNKELYQDDGKDYSDYEQVKSWTSGVKSQMLRAESVDRGSLHGSAQRRGLYQAQVSQQDDYDVPKARLMDTDDYDIPVDPLSPIAKTKPAEKPTKTRFTLPNLDNPSAFDPLNHTSEYLTPQNKPLEASAVATMKMVLLESSPKMLAQHITYLNLQLLKVTEHCDLGLGVHSGLELVTLPQGHQLRKDVLERFHCLQFYIAVITLICTKLPERARMLSLWIRVAMELRTMGDLYGFSAVMAGLGCSQLSRLSNTWSTLRSRHTDSFTLYDHKLSSSLRSLYDAASTLPLQNVSIPHIIPLVKILDLDPDYMCDLDLRVILGHLDTARVITEQCGLYAVTGQGVVDKMTVERHLLDLFSTETHLKLLFGYRAVSASPQERYPKFTQLLSVLSEKSEPTSTQKTANGETAL